MAFIRVYCTTENQISFHFLHCFSSDFLVYHPTILHMSATGVLAYYPLFRDEVPWLGSFKFISKLHNNLLHLPFFIFTLMSNLVQVTILYCWVASDRFGKR